MDQNSYKFTILGHGSNSSGRELDNWLYNVVDSHLFLKSFEIRHQSGKYLWPSDKEKRVKK